MRCGLGVRGRWGPEIEDGLTARATESMGPLLVRSKASRESWPWMVWVPSCRDRVHAAAEGFHDCSRAMGVWGDAAMP